MMMFLFNYIGVLQRVINSEMLTFAPKYADAFLEFYHFHILSTKIEYSPFLH